MSHTVYRIYTTGGLSNTYAVNRHEDWTIKMVQTNLTLEEAQKLIRTESLRHTTLLNLLAGTDFKDREKYTNEFCFGDRWLHERRFFLDEVPVAAIKKCLRNEGIRLI